MTAMHESTQVFRVAATPLDQERRAHEAFAASRGCIDVERIEVLDPLDE